MASDDEGGGPRPEGEEPPIDFTTFVLSLAQSATPHLDATDGTGGRPSTAQLALARQTIDLIVLLEQKTTGNLTGEEERILQQLLYDLKMRYLTASGEPG